jgi:hypothetical protein
MISAAALFQKIFLCERRPVSKRRRVNIRYVFKQSVKAHQIPIVDQYPNYTFPKTYNALLHCNRHFAAMITYKVNSPVALRVCMTSFLTVICPPVDKNTFCDHSSGTSVLLVF